MQVLYLTVLVTLTVSQKQPPRPTQPDPNVSHVIGNTTVLICTTKEIEADGVMRNAATDPQFRWTQFNVRPDPTYDENERKLINKAMYLLSREIPCVRFGVWAPHSSPTGDYVDIVKGKGCNSAVGRQGGRQTISLESPGCMHVGVIIHEMLHALGFYHEQSRKDRDDYITILWENIIEEYKFAFEKIDPPGQHVSPLNVPYNIRSVMHYPSWGFSKNKKPTMLTKSGKEFGYNHELHVLDIRKLQLLYNCTSVN